MYKPSYQRTLLLKLFILKDHYKQNFKTIKGKKYVDTDHDVSCELCKMIKNPNDIVISC